MICEDDISITNNEFFNKFIISFDKIKDNDNWDLITLTPYFCHYNKKQNDLMIKNGFIKLISLQTISCYIIKNNS